MRHFALLLIALIGCGADLREGGPPSASECVPLQEDVVLSSADDARAMPDCFDVAANTVTVEASEFRDLSALSGLREVRRLVIKGNPSLETTVGLEHVRILSELRLEDNPALVELRQIRNTQVVDRVALIDNPVLALVGLEDLKVVKGELLIQGATALEDLSDFAILEAVGNLKIYSTTGLKRLEARLIQAVATDVLVEGNQDLESFGGPSQLSDIGRHLSIQGNAALTTIAAFVAGLGGVGGTVTITHNPVLQDDFDLQHLIEIAGGSVIVTDNGFPDPTI